MTTSNIPITAGSGTIVATNSISEDAATKQLQRIVLNTSAGAEVDFTAASPVTQSGTWTVQIGNTPNTTAIKVDGSAVTQPVSGTLSASSVGFDVQTSVTRAANQTPYSINDVVGGAIDLGVLGPSAKTVMITSGQLELDIAAIPTGMTSFRLYLYSVTPPSALADNAAWDLPSGDRASYLGYIDLGTPVDLGSTCYCEVNGVNKQVLLAGTHLFGYLVTPVAYTPAANSEVYKVTLHTVGV